MMKMIYMSHPYTGDPNENIRRATLQTEKLSTKYPQALIINPLDVFRSIGLFSDYNMILAWCLELLARCDAIYMSDGWEDSKGCTAEYAFALREGITVLPKL